MNRNFSEFVPLFLSKLYLSDTVDALVEESGCRIENSLAIRLRDYVLNGHWNKALDVVEKFKLTLDEQQYVTVRVLLLESKFKDLLDRNEVEYAILILGSICV